MVAKKNIINFTKYTLFMGCCQAPVLGLRLGVDFTFAWDNNDKNNPHLNFVKGTVLGD